MFVVVLMRLVDVGAVLGAALGTVAAMVLGAGWVLHQSDGKEYPSREANARLDVLQQDTLVTDFGKYLGLTPTVSRLQCRDTPDRLVEPTLEAMFHGSRPDLSPEKVEALGKAAGWETSSVDPRHPLPGVDQSDTALYAVRLRKSFGTWESQTVVMVYSSSVELELDASADGFCP